MKQHIAPFLILIFLLAGLLVQAQDITFYDWNFNKTDAADARYFSIVKQTDSGYLRRDYYMKKEILQMTGLYKDSSFKIKTGTFMYFHPNKNLSSIGEFRNNKRAGLWLRYYSDGGLADSTVYTENGDPIGISLHYHRNGYLADSSITLEDGSGVRIGWFNNGSPSHAGRLSAGGKKNGKWNYFHMNGKLSAVEVYENDELISREHFNEAGSKLKDTVSDREAELPGGNSAWVRYLEKKISWPHGYKLANTDKVVVLVEFRVDEEGKIQDAEVVVPFADPFDRIALQTIRNSPVWNPAIMQNRRVSAVFRQPIEFRQEVE